MKCKAKTAKGTRCNLNSVIDGKCIAHYFGKKRIRRRYPKGCGFCTKRKVCQELKLNRQFICKTRLVNVNKGGWKEQEKVSPRPPSKRKC